MGITTLVRKQTHITPVVMVGAAFILGNLSVFLVSTLKEMQAKSHAPGGVDMFDFAILLAGMIGCIAINLAAYMNRGYGRWADLREEERAQDRRDTALRLRAAEGEVPPKPVEIKPASTQGVDPEGHLR